MIELPLGEGSVIFGCMDPADSNFQQIKTIILISHINIFLRIIFFPNMILFY